MMLAEGQPKPHRRQSESTCGAPVARFGVWVGPLAAPAIKEYANLGKCPNSLLAIVQSLGVHHFDTKPHPVYSHPGNGSCAVFRKSNLRVVSLDEE